MALIDIFKKAVGLFSPDNQSAQEGGFLNSVFLGTNSTPPRRGTKELLHAYNEMPWLRAVVNKVSRSVASTTWQLYVIKNGEKVIEPHKLKRYDYMHRKEMLKQYQKQGSLVEIDNHPLLDLLDNPNSFMTGLIFKQLTQIYLDLVGEAFWLKERNGVGVPIAFWPLPPHWVLNTPTPAYPFFKVSFGSWQEEIPETEILWMADPNPVNPYARGSGTAFSLADELETDEYAAKHTKTWFYNRARPDMIISGEGIKPEDTARLEQDWLSKNQGFWKAFKPYFMSKKVDVQTISQSFENMQLVDLRKHERDTIIQVYGVPPEILGIVENSNRATIESADYLFSRWVAETRLEFQRAFLQERLVPEFDSRLIIDYESPVSEDKEFNLKAAQAAPWSLTVDEWREIQGKEPLPDGQGQVYMLPFNLYPSKKLTSTSNVPPETPLPTNNAPEDGQPSPASTSMEDNNTEGELFYKPISKQHTKINSDDIRRILEKLSYKILIDTMSPTYKDIVQEFGQSTLDDIGVGISFDLFDPRVSAFLEVESSKYIKGINETTRSALQSQLAEGMAEGESIPKLAQRVSDVFTDADERRATMISRTETGRAANFATLEGMKQGGVEEKEWLATRDDRVRDSHLEADKQIQPVDKPFILGSGAEAMYPGESGIPEEDINCRCAIRSIINGKSMYDTEEKRVSAWKKYDSDLMPWERRMANSVRKAFKQQEEIILEELKKYA